MPQNHFSYSIYLSKTMLKKGKHQLTSQTVKNFDEFVRRRLQKKSILQSQGQTIDKKVACFEQLLKMTKTGTMLATQVRTQSNTAIPKSEKEISFRREQAKEIQENAQSAFGRLDKMAHDVNGWFTTKNTSVHETQDQKRAININKKNIQIHHEKKFKKFDYKSTNISRVQSGTIARKYQTESIQQECTGGKDRRKQKQYHVQLPKRSYSKNMLFSKNPTKTISIPSKTPDFSSLRQQINMYERKAKQLFGINFDIKQKNVTQNDLEQIFLQKQENVEMMRVISLNEAKKSQMNPYSKLIQQHTKQDSSVPLSLLGIVRASSGRNRKIMGNSASGSRYIRV